MQHIFLQITRILYIYTVKVFDFKLKGELRFNILSFHESIDHLHKKNQIFYLIYKFINFHHLLLLYTETYGYPYWFYNIISIMTIFNKDMNIYELLREILGHFK